MMKTGKRESARLARLYKDRQMVADLRKHFTGYEPAAGYSLSPKKLYEIPYSRKRALRAKHAKLQELLKKPFVDFVTPADDISRKALRKFTGERLRGMKHFIVAKPSAESQVRVVEGNVQLRTQFPGSTAFTERFYMFPKVPRSHAHMLKMFDKMAPNLPKGTYVLQTDTYGDTGDLVQRGGLRRELLRLLEAYDKPKYGEHRFMYRIAGFRWFATTKEGRLQLDKRDDARAGQREWNRKEREKLQAEIAAAKKKRCRYRDPFSGERCIKEAGHKGQHKFEE
jgi:hypothetical protein